MDESDGFVEVQVWRTGTDLSKGGTITVRSRKTDPVSAEGMWRYKVPFCVSIRRLVKKNKRQKTIDSSHHPVTFCFPELKSPRRD